MIICLTCTNAYTNSLKLHILWHHHGTSPKEHRMFIVQMYHLVWYSCPLLSKYLSLWISWTVCFYTIFISILNVLAVSGAEGALSISEAQHHCWKSNIKENALLKIIKTPPYNFLSCDSSLFTSYFFQLTSWLLHQRWRSSCHGSCWWVGYHQLDLYRICEHVSIFKLIWLNLYRVGRQKHGIWF